MADTLINWHRAACTCEGEDRCIHCQTVAALAVRDILLKTLERTVAHDGAGGRIGPLHRAARSKTPGIAGEAQRLIDRIEAAITKATAA